MVARVWACVPLRANVILAVLAALAASAGAQSVIEGDLKYLICPVCQKVAGVLVHTLNDARKAGMDIQEEAVAQLVGATCDVRGPIGGWLRSADYRLSDDQKSFEIDLHDTIGRCGSECVTMARACSQLLDAGEEIVEALMHAEWEPEEFAVELCQELTSACTKRKAIKNPKGRGREQFEPLSEEEMMAEYESQYGDEEDMLDGEDYPDGYDEEMGMGGLPMRIVDSPLARLENWLWDKYVSVTSWLGLSGGASPSSTKKRPSTKTEV